MTTPNNRSNNTRLRHSRALAFTIGLLLVGCGGTKSAQVTDMQVPTMWDGDEWEGYPNPYVVADKMPEPIGGLAKLSALIDSERVYPYCSEYGRIVGSMLIDKEGRVALARVVQPDRVNPECEERFIAALQLWEFRPGEHDGMPVDFVMSIPVTLKSN